MNIKFEDLKSEFKRVLLKKGIQEDIAERVSQVLAENDLDGIHTHGSIRFPAFSSDLDTGEINLNGRAEKVAGFGGYEVYDGKGGLGIYNGSLATERAMELADKYGIGLVALKNTNHWMRGGSYAWQATKKGYGFMAWTNSFPNMPAWGSNENKLGNSPIVVGVPRENGEDVVVDMALTQYSFGKLQENSLKGQKLQVPGGYNAQGELTSDPDEIIETRHLIPTGYWKGSSLSIAIDMLGVLLSEGNSVYEIGKKPGNFNITQVYICIRPDENVDLERVNKLIDESLEDLKTANKLEGVKEIRYPGERVIRDRKHNLENGIPIHEEIWNKIKAL